MVFFNCSEPENAFKCSKCDFSTNHRGHYNVHIVEGCGRISSAQDLNCDICCRPCTRNQLRYHLRQYFKDSSKANNGHEFFTPAQHVQLMDRIKMEGKLVRKMKNAKNKKDIVKIKIEYEP